MVKSKRLPVTLKLRSRRALPMKKISKKNLSVSITLQDLEELIELADRPFQIFVDRALEELVHGEFEEIDTRLNWMVKRMDKIMDCIVRQQHYFGCAHWRPEATEKKTNQQPKARETDQ